MHLFKNIADHLVGLLSGCRDSAKVRNEEKCRNRFRATWLGKDHKAGKPLLPTPFVLSKEQVHLANLWCADIECHPGLIGNRKGPRCHIAMAHTNQTTPESVKDTRQTTTDPNIEGIQADQLPLHSKKLIIKVSLQMFLKF